METKKMSLANIQGKLSRAEMKNIMAGYTPIAEKCTCNSPDDCTTWNEKCMNSGCDSSNVKAGTCGCP